jgi:hypothetical protein
VISRTRYHDQLNSTYLHHLSFIQTATQRLQYLLVSPPQTLSLTCIHPSSLQNTSTLTRYSHEILANNPALFVDFSLCLSSRQIHSAAISAISTPGATVTAYCCLLSLTLKGAILRSMCATTRSRRGQSVRCAYVRESRRG